MITRNGRQYKDMDDYQRSWAYLWYEYLSGGLILLAMAATPLFIIVAIIKLLSP